ncbi:lasso peptide biosynthesis PqqD family chaperone [Goodfellowiella coeruleoviolacea]|uniref:Coenzyme PQQ synthesis protein D (PqqD) n=1 Tax=Goodfellowiella coeruleoviolacea TaxID=334858 RepID=A0AAE3GIT0_9PSEU|nr:lasso peptide biosynthesis PqqD family chaperone [Goodfellowiella coeruleoviolacea]MCP2168940.1 Coenzyme PQQ synthesis protein D (PqqD) [Goodfellowiella coeruleoviolacea]
MILRLHPEVSTVDTEEAMVLVDQRSGRSWQLNRTGAVLLRTMLAGHSTEEVANQLSHWCAVPRDQAVADVDELINRLRVAGLLTRA